MSLRLFPTPSKNIDCKKKHKYALLHVKLNNSLRPGAYFNSISLPNFVANNVVLFSNYRRQKCNFKYKQSPHFHVAHYSSLIYACVCIYIVVQYNSVAFGVRFYFVANRQFIRNLTSFSCPLAVAE
ncbi:hypothetical protein QTP88_022695 [Uroleucon formosanum]